MDPMGTAEPDRPGRSSPRAREVGGQTIPAAPLEPLRAMSHLVAVIQELSLARDLEAVTSIVRRAARELTGADGATFVLREGDLCHYADEDAIGPLWKGRRFPMTSCISGWTMRERRPAVVEDVYSDPRISVEAYRSTFVRSLVMVPIRTLAPVGAIGSYWAARHRASREEVKVLQTLADSTSTAMENVQLYGELERRVRERTEQLEAANRELEAFSCSVAHDLRAPLRGIDGFSKALLEDYAGRLDERGRAHLERVRSAAQRMGALIDDLLELSRIGRAELRRHRVDLSELARAVGEELARRHPERDVRFIVHPGQVVRADSRLLRIVLENLLDNAWKFSSKVSEPVVEVGQGEHGGECVHWVKDNGAGFDMGYADKLFGPFQRLHLQGEFPGTGIGLATVQRIIHRHGGRVWPEGRPGRGATFYFTLGCGLE